MVAGVGGEEPSLVCPYSLLLRVMPCFSCAQWLKCLEKGPYLVTITMVWLEMGCFWPACSSNLSGRSYAPLVIGWDFVVSLCLEAVSSSFKDLVAALSEEFTAGRLPHQLPVMAPCDSNTLLSFWGQTLALWTREILYFLFKTLQLQ